MSKYITRTVLGTKAEIKTVDLATDAVATEEFILSKTFKENEHDKVLKEVNKAFKALNLNKSAVAVLSYTQTEKLYGITPESFMANSIELDTVTRKPLNTDTTETVNE